MTPNRLNAVLGCDLDGYLEPRVFGVDELVFLVYLRAQQVAFGHDPIHNSDTCRVCAVWLREAAEWYRGPLLAQFSLADSVEFESWLVVRRETLHREAMEAFARLAGFYLRRARKP